MAAPVIEVPRKEKPPGKSALPAAAPTAERANVAIACSYFFVIQWNASTQIALSQGERAARSAG